MKKAELKKILQDMAITAGMVNLYRDEKKYENNIRECPWYSELVGEMQILRLLGIEFNWDFSSDCRKYVSVSANGIKIEV